MARKLDDQLDDKELYEFLKRFQQTYEESDPGWFDMFAPDATCLGVINTPEYAANFAWGDADYRSLYITASTSVYRIRVQVPGLPAL